MKRIAAIAVMLMVLFPSGASAIGGEVDFSKWHWSNTYSRWVDDSCGTSAEQFELVVWNDIDYGSHSTKICKAWADLCEVPLGALTLATLTGVDCIGTNRTASDRISSARLKSGIDTCVGAYSSVNYLGSRLVVLGDYPNLHGMGWGDRFESLKLAC